ncbi:Predicted PurR-regulated permease PerM [Ruaniaceae bacterium KH17]|nr:Predicted PurR-regulated permease PerM [Ruaniaceae bacterium KH17]
MSEKTAQPSRFAGIHRAGITAWSALGIILLVVAIATVVGALSGILVPLVVAAILGVVLAPWVSWLERHRVPSALAAAIGMLTAVLVAVGMVYLVVAGFIRELPEIGRQLTAGWDALARWGRSLDLSPELLDRIRDTVMTYAPKVSQGTVGLVGSTITGGISLAMGAFFGLFFLFFVLKDFHRFGAWVARVTGTDPEVVDIVKGISLNSVQGYFRGTALTALITGPIFILPLILLRVPLVIPIAIVYFFLSFIPYLGAWITAVFAVLIAFGATGPMGALIVLIALIVSNGTIQSAVGSWALGSSLSLHPVLVLIATIAGGTVAGMLGMILGPPIAAAVAKSVVALRERNAPEPEAEIEAEVPAEDKLR